VIYGLLVLRAGIAAGQQVFDIVAVTVALSIVVHSSSDVPVARMFKADPAAGGPAR
jgi:NhaP-type Na+/H+ or K+/H+ antiporter